MIPRRAMETTSLHESSSLIRNSRYRRIITFFVTMILHVIWWALVVARIPLVGFRARQTRAARQIPSVESPIDFQRFAQPTWPAGCIPKEN